MNAQDSNLPRDVSTNGKFLLILQHQFEVLLPPDVCDISLLEIAASMAEWAENNL